MRRLAIIAALFVTACTPLDVICPILPFDEGACVLKKYLDDPKEFLDEAADKRHEERHTEPAGPPAP